MIHPSYLALQKEIGRINELERIPHLAWADLMESVLEPYRLQQQLLSEQMAQIVKVSDMSFVSQSLLSALKTIQIDTSHIMSVVHKSWTVEIRATQDMMAEIQKLAGIELAKSVQIAAIAESVRTQIDFSELYDAFKIEKSIISNYGEMLSFAENSYSQLAKSLATLPKLVEVPPFVMPSASREMFASEYATYELMPDKEEAEEDDYVEIVADVQAETSGVQHLLHKVNSELAIAHQGAKDALRSKNADYARHVLSSLRELWNHLIRTLAPDDKVMPWIGNNSHYLHDGKPTRKARIEYICREFNHKPLSSFLFHDTSAFVAMIGLLHRIHELDIGLTDMQLNVLILRSDSWLTFILPIAMAGDFT